MSTSMTARIATRAVVYRAPPSARLAQHQRPAFSTTSRTLNAKPTENPTLPSFNLKSIVSNPRTRFYLLTGLGVMACIEAYGWYTFGPKVFGKGEVTEEEK